MRAATSPLFCDYGRFHGLMAFLFIFLLPLMIVFVSQRMYQDPPRLADRSSILTAESTTGYWLSTDCRATLFWKICQTCWPSFGRQFIGNRPTDLWESGSIFPISFMLRQMQLYCHEWCLLSCFEIVAQNNRLSLGVGQYLYQILDIIDTEVSLKISILVRNIGCFDHFRYCSRGRSLVYVLEVSQN